MEYSIGVATPSPGNDLLQKATNRGQRQTDTLTNVVTGLELVHVRFQIVRHVLKDKVQAAGMGLDNIKQFDLV